MKLQIQFTAVLAAITTTIASVVKPPETGKGTFELLILHNNDMHARFEQTSQHSGTCTDAEAQAGRCYGGFARVAHVVKEARKAAADGTGPPVLYLNAGDTYTGTIWFNLYKWRIAAEFINLLQPDAMSLGNHEFDDGVSALTPYIRNITCPTVAANLILTKEPSLEVEPKLMKSVIFDVNGTKIGVIGYLTPDTKVLAGKNNVEYVEETIAISKEAKRLKELGVNFLIALGHSGFAKDLEIAEKVEDIDLVIGGHTNTFLWNGAKPDAEPPEGPYPTIVKQASGRLVPAVQAYCCTKYMGNLRIKFDSVGEIVHYESNPILLDNSVPQDSEVLNIIKKYKSEVMKVSEIIVGHTSVKLDGLCRLEECNLGNLIADSMVHKYASEYKGDGWTDAPVAIIQGGGIRSTISLIGHPGNVTNGDLMTVMPFEGKIVKVAMNGATFLKMLEHSVENYKSTRPVAPFLQYSGVHVEYDLKCKPGLRVKKALIRCGMCDVPEYFPLDKSKSYSVLMPQFLSTGGDEYSMFEGLPTKILDFNEINATKEFIASNSPVHPAVEGRVILYNAPKTNSADFPVFSTVLLLITVILY